LVHHVQQGDEGALARLVEIVDAAAELARGLMDPAEQAESSMIESYASDDRLVRETLPRTLKAMRMELTEGCCCPLERLLVKGAVATWLQLQYVEVLYAQNMRGLTIQQSEFHERRIDRAHRRHLSAVRTLAQIRKLGPAVQINLAEMQINATR
jgi:hypothetical protein